MCMGFNPKEVCLSITIECPFRRYFMTSCDLEKWITLLTQIEVIGEPSPLSAEQLLYFELRAGVTLPSGYKEFCQVFGDGVFGRNMFSIECPKTEDVKGQLISHAEIIAACKFAKSASEYPLEIKILLDSAYLIGFGEGYVLFVLDLRTYSESDQSYDIYAFDDNGHFYKVGRDFFEFVRDFCMGTKAEEDFPELLKGLPVDLEEDSVFARRAFITNSI